MSEKSWESEGSLESIDETEFVIEEEDTAGTGSREDGHDVAIADMENPYIDDPVADDVWLRQYREKREIKDKENKELTDRFVGNTALNVWCSCGRCNTSLLENPRECKCCKEVEGCAKALVDELVLSEAGNISCVTQHPGFKPVVLEKWSLRQAADRYRTKDFTKYYQKGSENDFLRSVAYREFTRLVHRKLGKIRIPLPACAYNVIRSSFPSDQAYIGFEDNSN